VIIHEVDEHDGYPYMVLEHIEGQSLRAWMDERRADAEAPMAPVPTSLAVELMVPVVRALSCAHKLGIVHCDARRADRRCPICCATLPRAAIRLLLPTRTRLLLTPGSGSTRRRSTLLRRCCSPAP
jgi:hypothetical protein